MSPIRFIYAIFWIAIALGVGDALVDMTNFMRSEAIHAHKKGLMSYTQFTKELTGQK